MRKMIFALLLMYSVQALTQTNGVFVSDFKLDNFAEKWSWAISQDTQRNMLLGVTNGVVVFDGQNQNFIKLPYTPSDILLDSARNYFLICGYEHVGILKPKGHADFAYQPLSELEEGVAFDKIILLNDTAYFVSPGGVMRFDVGQQAIIDFIPAGSFNIEETFILNHKFYCIIDYFPFEIKNGSFVELENVDFPVDEFSYTISVSPDQVILGTSGETFYFFDGKRFKTRSIKKSPFFDNNLIVDAAKINDSTLLLSSLGGGIALLDINKLEITSQLSYFNGLPDDEIRTFFIDADGAIWVSHEFGISRIDFNLGIESYSFYPGLKGTPIALTFTDNTLYVATSDGLFALSEVKKYNEFEVSVSVPINVSVAVNEPAIETEYTPDVSEEQKENSRSLFSFLSKKKRKTTDSQEAESSDVQENSSIGEFKKRETVKTERRTIKKRSLKSVSHYFNLVEGVNDKCSQLVTFQGSLLVAGNNGLYVVDAMQGKKLISNVYVHSIYVSDCCPEAYIATSNGLYKVFKKGKNWEVSHFAETTLVRINAIVHESDGTWILGFENMVVRAHLSNKNIEVINQAKLLEASGRSFFIKTIDEKTMVFGSNAIYEFTPQGALELVRERKTGSLFIGNQSDYLWEWNKDQWNLLARADSGDLQQQLIKIQLFSRVRHINVTENNDVWIITEDNNFYKITSKPLTQQLQNFKLVVAQVRINDSIQIATDRLQLKPGQNILEIDVSAPFYTTQNGVKYRYKVYGLPFAFSDWSSKPQVALNYLPPGNFKVMIETRNGFGKIAKAPPIELKIAKPFTQTAAFIICLILLVGGLVYLVFRVRLQVLKRDKEILEQRVKERTQTIEEQKDKIEKQHDEITQSIRYAKRIQTAMLPHNEIIEAMLPAHFILFKPRDIVSGDFYFFKPLGNKLVFIAADCTGHGVPGGFMSMLGISFLSEITSQLHEPSAAEILNHLREKIKLTLGQSGAESSQKDGMDMSVSLIDTENKRVEFAGAFNPLYYIRNNELEIVKADRQPVSVYFKESEFNNHYIDVQKGDVFYMFSDGYQDQIGGPNQRKFMTKKFKTLLLDIHKKTMENQHQILEETIEKWRGESMQVDDILVIGFQV